MLFLAHHAVIVAEIGRIEFAHGKRHIIEDSARVILVSNYAFLIGHSVLGRIDQILCWANDPNDRENTDRNDEFSLVMIAVAEPAVYSECNIFGNILTAATTAARIAFVLFNDLGRKDNGVDNFYHCLGDVLFAAAGLGDAAEAIAGGASEDAYVAFAAVKDDLLLYHRYTLKFLRASGREASFEKKLDVKSYCE